MLNLINENEAIIKESLGLINKKVYNLISLVESENTLKTGRFPFVTREGKWIFKDSWANGFFIGEMLLLYRITKEKNCYHI
ncbi:hypothetical protein I6G82_02110 [Lysinibacillus macroides]|uniref:Uncharacterized protein n=1 Tax=Lysinibacillus macroides TaxID=33935 RepID=A0A0N1J051_9BACI|nr:hypothetical protein [Lysinibacillus macroides]KOY81377.1 hypothetical protein ADM90_19845 [Lysinibacillus macroides]QPR68450.1 hypothetical protein I6G82_02110 [Lysinibacillus macroides]